MLRSIYVRAVRLARTGADRLGVLRLLEGRRSRLATYLRSLFAIYDAQDLARLDLPWWCFDAIDEVEAFLAARPDARVFEYGSGASTLWLASRAAQVRSVEHDAAFAATIRELLPTDADVELLTVEAHPIAPGDTDPVTSARSGADGLDFRDYVDTINRDGGTYDLVVVDGRARVASLFRALPHVAAGGMVVFDDVERSRYRPALHVPGVDTVVHRGLTPCVPFPTSTALLRPRG